MKFLDWNTRTPAQKIEAAEWLENDAEYLRREAARYAASESEDKRKFSERIRGNAEHSASLAAQIRAEVPA